MTVFDYTVLTIMGVSVLLSLMRGFFREVMSLLGWVVALVVAKYYTLQLAPLLPQGIPSNSLRLLAAFVILFLGTLLVASLLSIALSGLFSKVGLGWLDRWLGAMFGIARGVLIVGVLVLLGGLTSLPHDVRWRNAMFSATLEAMVISVLPWLPQDISKHVKYD